MQMFQVQKVFTKKLMSSMLRNKTSNLHSAKNIIVQNFAFVVNITDYMNVLHRPIIICYLGHVVVYMK